MLALRTVWFIFLIIGLTLLLLGGLYTRRRLNRALVYFGVGRRAQRLTSWLSAWLLFGFPVLTFAAIFLSRYLGSTTRPSFDGAAITWLLVYPFFISLLVMVQSLPFLLGIDLARLVGRLAGPWRREPRASRVDRFRATAVLAVLALFALYTPARIIAQRDALRVRHYTLAPSIDHARTAAATPLPSPAPPPLPGSLPPASSPASALPPFRIAFVADVQQDANTGPAEVGRVVKIINGERPDLVLSGGDWINTGPEYIAAAAATAGTLQSRLGTFSVRGDHEHFAYNDRHRSVAEIERALAAHEVTMLNNQVRWFDHHGKRIAVAFLNYNYIFRSDDLTIRELISQVAGADYSILVTHQFDEHVAALAKDKVDLVLGAHTHGGQVNPVLGLVHVPLARLETRYIDGRYELGRTTVITTSGIGYSLVPFRYASPGSLEILDVEL